MESPYIPPVGHAGAVFGVFPGKKDHLFPVPGIPFYFRSQRARDGPPSALQPAAKPVFAQKQMADKEHGQNPFKMPVFQKYGNNRKFSSGVGTVSPAEFPGRKPLVWSPSENRSTGTYRPAPAPPPFINEVPGRLGEFADTKVYEARPEISGE